MRRVLLATVVISAVLCAYKPISAGELSASSGVSSAEEGVTVIPRTSEKRNQLVRSAAEKTFITSPKALVSKQTPRSSYGGTSPLVLAGGNSPHVAGGGNSPKIFNPSSRLEAKSKKSLNSASNSY